MSTFPGLVEEIPGISIDNFTRDNIYSKLHFLSHCHTDHMYGIGTLFASSQFKREGVFLYGSPTTVVILKNMFSDLPVNVIELSVGMKHFLKIDYARNICVTLISAGHCPGSVMFLFEGEKTILYTGDIRLTVENIKELKCFKNMSGSIKKIDKMYFDSTFFTENYFKFPPREKSIEEFIKSVKYGLQDINNNIFYGMPAKYGSEFLMIETFKEVKMPFRVNPDIYKTYKYIPEMDEVVTLDPKKTRIYAATFPEMQKLSFNSNSYQIRTTARRWNNEDFSEGICEKLEDGSYFICYSSHCSYQEILDIIHYLKPLDLFPCVVPKNPKEKSIMNALIKKTLDDIQKIGILEGSNGKKGEIGPRRSWIFSENIGETKNEIKSCTLPGKSGDSADNVNSRKKIKTL